MYRVVLNYLTLLFISFCVSCLPTHVDAASTLRSAFLGPTVWEDGLTSQQINQQLREHFVEVIDQLEKKHVSSLLTALRRAEAASAKRWTEADRRAALIYLARNRQKQIGRLHTYMNRGRFPLNQGQASSPVPIFVDRNQTRCAVGYLMHSDNRDQEVTSIVKANNLVRILDVNKGSLIDWVRSSGLTQEEAAMIQPFYPINLDATFEDLLSSDFTSNDITISDVSVKSTRFNVDLPQSLADSPETFQTVLNAGRELLDSDNMVDTAFLQQTGVLFGTAGVSGGSFFNAPNNLDQFIRFGPDNGLSGNLVGPPLTSGNAGLIAIEYTLQSDSERFSELALTVPEFTGSSQAFGEQSAVLLRSEFFSGQTDELLGVGELSAIGGPSTGPSSLLSGSCFN